MTVRVPMLNTDTDTAETFRLALGAIWVPASALNARTGVTSIPTLTGTGNLTATISPFTAVIDGTSGSLQGSYPIAQDSTPTITITAGNTQPRIDLICLQVQDNDYDGSGAHQGIPVVVAGTPSGSPAAPATPANAIPLWTIPVPALATSLTWSTATAVFPYTAAAGGVTPVRNAGDKPAAVNGVGLRWRLDVTAAAGSTSPLEGTVDGTTYKPIYDASVVPATTTSAINTATAAVTAKLLTCTSTTRPSSPAVGQMIVETDTLFVRRWDGSAWVTMVDPASGYGAWTNLTVGSGWSTPTGETPQYRTTSVGRYEFRGQIQATSIYSGGSTVLTNGPSPSGTPRSVACSFANSAGTGCFTFPGSGNMVLNLSGISSVASGTIVLLDNLSVPS